MSLGARIREERRRLRKNQTEFAAIAGASRRALANWEADGAAPVVTVLTAWASAGADAVYILTGMRTIDTELHDGRKWEDTLKYEEGNLLDASLGMNSHGIESDESRARRNDFIELFDWIIKEATSDGAPQWVIDRAKKLREVASDPQKLIDFRAAAFAQRKREEDSARDDFRAYFKGLDYQPNENVLEKMVQLQMEFSIYYEPLVNLVRAVARDVTGRG